MLIRPAAAPCLLRIAFALTLLVLGALPAFATVEQQIIVRFDPDFDASTPDDTGSSDSIRVPTSGDIDRAIFASINDPGRGFSASGSVGVFGNLGVQGMQIRSGELLSQVVIESDEFLNLSSSPAEVRANFIIDGGLFELVFAPGATLEYQLDVFGRSPSLSILGGFQTGGMLVGDASGTTTFSTFGSDIGATFDGLSQVEIPLSFQSAVLGTVQPGERLEIQYQLDIRTNVPAFAEVLRYEFSDPLDVDGPGDFPGSMDLEVVPVIPEPGTALLLGLGLVGLGASRRSARGR